MDKRTRVLNAMNKKEVDHVPVGFWFHFAGEEASGQGCINAHLKYYRETDLDFVKIMCDGYFPYPLPKIEKAEDFKTLNPLPAEHPGRDDDPLRHVGHAAAAGKHRDLCR